MDHSTYSFDDVVCAFSHPAKGVLTLTGAGIGSATLSRSNDVSEQHTASDGSIMTTKKTSKNGTLTIVVQQSSYASKWLRKLNQYLETAPTPEWTQSVCGISNRPMGLNITCTGVSPQKAPDVSFQASGQEESFVYLYQECSGM